MTTPRDAISGLSERLRKTLGCIEPDDFRGDNLAIFIASELEPSIDDETLDDSQTWKQGALDACDRVLDAIHAHYATQLDSLLKERDALEAERDELRMDFDHAMQEFQIRNNELKAAESRALRAEQERDEAYERLKPFAECAADIPPNVAEHGVRCCYLTFADLRAARDLVRRLSAGPEKEKPAANDGEERR